MSELRGPEYVRGYRAAMKYAAEFVREAGTGGGTPFKAAFEVLAKHLEEKVGMTEAAAATEAKLVAALKNVNPPAGYSKLQSGVRCRCVKLWFDGTDHYCCNAGIASSHRDGFPYS